MRSAVKKKRRQKRKSAFSLIEVLVVIVIIAMLVALAIPGINAMQKSFNSTGAEGMISAALATARTLAMSHQQYAGVRFQKIYDKKGPLEANQYMVFIIYDEDKSGLTCGFIAVEGYKPVKLPENVGVFDLKVRRYTVSSNPRDCGSSINEGDLLVGDLDDSVAANLDPDNNNRNITDISTFSIVFSPSGKLVSHEIRCRNKNAASRSNDSSNDDIFNTKNNVEKKPPVGMFIQDDFDDYGIGVETSRTKFVIYDRAKFEKMAATGNQRWNYLSELKSIYVNPYTGEIIK
jgi:prepilin-type N-terminal cleavage/methylation domain-containing protein